MNNVILLGRLVADANLKYLQGGNNNAVARFTLAVDKGLSKEKKEEMESKGQPTADFINCQAWGKMAESLVKYSGKGLRVLVNGRIQTGSYEKDGQRIYTTEVIANNIEYIDWKNSNFQNGNNSNGYNKGYAIDATVADNATLEEHKVIFTEEDRGRIPF